MFCGFEKPHSARYNLNPINAGLKMCTACPSATGPDLPVQGRVEEWLGGHKLSKYTGSGKRVAVISLSQPHPIINVQNDAGREHQVLRGIECSQVQLSVLPHSIPPHLGVMGGTNGCS